MRLHFNKIGYKMYGKEQSRRVPSHNAKPGNPGYGFRRARWRDTLNNEQDSMHCENMLRSISCDDEQIKRVKKAVQEYRERWETVRRPSRPAGPGRPRRAFDSGPRLSDGEEGDMPPTDSDALGKKRPADALAAPVSNVCTFQSHDLWWTREDIAGSKRARSEVSSGTPPGGDFALHTVGASPFLQLHSNINPTTPAFLRTAHAATCAATGAAGFVRSGHAVWSPFSAAFAAAGSGAAAWRPPAVPGQEAQFSSLTLPPLRLHSDAGQPEAAQASLQHTSAQLQNTSSAEDLPGLVRDRSVDVEVDASKLHALARLVCSASV